MAKKAKTAKTTKPTKATKAAKPAKAAKKAPVPKAAKAAKKPAKPVSLKEALAPIAGPAGKAKWQPVLTATESPRRYLHEIKISNRFRKHKGDITALAKSIDDRGALLEPIVIAPDGTLIDGERRMLAWEKSEVGGHGKEPIPVSVVDIDSIIAGEYDANEQREPFKPTELVAIKRAIEDKLAASARERQGHGLTAPGRKKSGEVAGKGRTADRVGAAAGVSGRTVEKAAAVVDAAERDPERFGKLADDMDRTGKVDGAHKRLKIMEATDRIRTAPPPLPGNGPYATMSIDFPWPFEGDAEQEEIDAAGRSLRPYPAMSIKSGCNFLRDEVAPLLAPDCSVWFWTTNHHLVKGYAHHLIAALGFEGRGSTMLTWVKDKIGRGKALRDKTEHAILLTRGNPVINGLGEDPPTTEMRAPRRENSRKPDEFYRLVERVTPAPRYAAIFSTGGEGELWDGHGDQVDKHTPAAPRSLLDQLALVEAGEGASLTADERAALATTKLVTGRSAAKIRLTRRGEDDLVSLREEHTRAQLLAAMPDDFDGLAALYRDLLANLDTAVRGSDDFAVDELIERMDLVEAKVRSLRGDDEPSISSPYFAIRRLVSAAAAPIGETPGWGQRGMYRVEIEGVPYIVSFAGRAMCDFDVHAEDAGKPFLAPTGFHAFYGDARPPLGSTVAQHVEATIREEMDGWDGKPPTHVYRLPESWSDADSDDGGPVEVTSAAPADAPVAAPKHAKRRGKTAPAQLDLEQAIAGQPAETAAPATDEPAPAGEPAAADDGLELPAVLRRPLETANDDRAAS